MEYVKEIKLSLENKPGTLSTVSELLGANAINIIAFYVSAEGQRGTLRFVANDPEKAINVLTTAGYGVSTKEVLACETPHHPGGLNAILKPLKLAGINVDYIYPCLGTGAMTVLIIGVEDPERAEKVLKENWIRILGPELYHF
ncbi:MAG: ACT domain-containing protein [Desulfatiglandales bacterium]